MWIQVVRGEIALDGQCLASGDGAAVEEVDEITLMARHETEFLLFDLG